MGSELAICGGKPMRKASFPMWPVYGENEKDALARVICSGKWGRLDGNEVARFERRFAAYQGAKYGIAVTSGTVALRIALLAMGIQPGDEVIVPAYTFMVTATCVIESNATPIFVDIEPDTYNISPKAIEAAITDRTKAIIPVHFGGLSANMDAIMSIAKQNNLTVIEDAAHAHGAEYKGRHLGSIGHIGCFSFQSTKNLSSGEGGIITTCDDKLAVACRSIHNCGRVEQRQQHKHYTISGNYRMTEFQGAILNSQLDRLDQQCTKREQNGKYLAKCLSQIPGIEPQARGCCETRHSYHLFIFRYDKSTFGIPRNVFVKAANAEGIPIREGYSLPLYRQPVFVNKAFGPYTGCFSTKPELDYTKVSCPVTEKACYSEGMWVLQEVLLGSQADMDYIIRTFEKIYKYRDELRTYPTFVGPPHV